jgi:hypothetical protein
MIKDIKQHVELSRQSCIDEIEISIKRFLKPKFLKRNQREILEFNNQNEKFTRGIQKQSSVDTKKTGLF